MPLCVVVNPLFVLILSPLHYVFAYISTCSLSFHVFALGSQPSTWPADVLLNFLLTLPPTLRQTYFQCLAKNPLAGWSLISRNIPPKLQARVCLACPRSMYCAYGCSVRILAIPSPQCNMPVRSAEVSYSLEIKRQCIPDEFEWHTSLAISYVYGT